MVYESTHLYTVPLYGLTLSSHFLTCDYIKQRGPLWKTCRCHGLTPSNVKLTLKLKLTITTYWFSLNREKWDFVLLTITEKWSII